MKNRGRGGGRSRHRFEAGFALLLGAGFADPYHAAAHGAQRVLVQDKFDHLSAPQVKMPVEPEPFSVESTTRQGIRVWFRWRLMTRLAGSSRRSASIGGLPGRERWWASSSPSRPRT